MSSSLRTSGLRAGLGATLLVGGALVAAFVLPDASRRLERERIAQANAKASLDQQQKRVEELQSQVDRIQEDRKRIEDLEKNMPKGSVGELQWALSKALYDLAQKSAVRLQSVKYGNPSREGAKGTDLEAMDVEFNALGVYQNMKRFMHSLEGSGLPFAVNSVRMEESPEGARLTVTLRSFRKGGAAKDETREEA